MNDNKGSVWVGLLGGGEMGWVGREEVECGGGGGRGGG